MLAPVGEHETWVWVCKALPVAGQNFLVCEHSCIHNSKVEGATELKFAPFCSSLDALSDGILFSPPPFLQAVGCQDGTVIYYQLLFNTVHALYRDR